MAAQNSRRSDAEGLRKACARALTNVRKVRHPDTYSRAAERVLVAALDGERAPLCGCDGEFDHRTDGTKA